MERQAANMKLRRYFRRAMAAALCLMLCAGLAQPAWASSGSQMTLPIPGFSADKDCTLTLNYGADTAGMTVRVYRVASMNEYVRFSAEGVFDGWLRSLSVDLNNPASFKKDWRALASTLKGMVRSAGIMPETGFREQTDQTGKVSFTMKPGLYLVFTDHFSKPVVDAAGEPVYDALGNSSWMEYDTTPYLLTLPMWLDQSAGEKTPHWDWAPARPVNGKVSKEPRKEIGVTVVKVWVERVKGEDGKQYDRVTEDHPGSVTFQLIRDGTTVERQVTLPDQYGRWSVTWTGLSSQYDWSVREIRNGTGWEDWEKPEITFTKDKDFNYHFTVVNRKNPTEVSPPTTDPTPMPSVNPTPTPSVNPTPTPSVNPSPTPSANPSGPPVQ